MNTKNFLINFLFVIISISANSCTEKAFYPQVIELKIQSEIAECEKRNIFFKVKEVNTKEFNFLKGEFILPNCSDAICEKNIYTIKHFDTTKVFTVKGKLSKYPHVVKDYGCPSSLVFEILEVVDK